MKLYSFSATNYRSIKEAHKIHINDMTILVGKNNEGKSNLLEALSLSMKIIKNSRIVSKRPFRDRPYSMDRGGSYYSWDRDFPVSLRERKGTKETIFKLEFLLDENEIPEFNKKIKSKITTNIISIEIRIDERNSAKITVPKKGTPLLTEKKDEVSEFIANKIVFNYIPAIRTEYDAVNIIRDTLSQELIHLESKKEYIDALETINKLQEEPLKNISKKVSEALKMFLPTVNSVEIEIADEIRRQSLRRDIDVFIDDGASTKIEYKGDGVKSLAALAMLKERYSVDSASIIAIDEPEAHLHPEAINQLNQILNGLIQDNQVIISTHNPLFVNKSEIKSNIIVSSGKATPARNIAEIREILGVKLSDNLISYKYALIVEGDTDKLVIEKLLKKSSEKIKKSFDLSELTIVSLGGASNLSSELYRTRNGLFNYHVLLDKDLCAQQAFDKAIENNLITVKQVTFTNCNGMRESELEDCFKIESYSDKIMNEYSVNLNCREFKNNKKWTERMETTFIANSRRWTEKIEKDVKEKVAFWVSEYIEEFNIEALSEHKGECLKNLIRSLEEMIK